MPLPTKDQLQKLKQAIDANRPKPLLLTPDNYRARVASVVEKNSRKNGDRMLQVGFRLLDIEKRPLIFGFVMLEGKGAYMGDAFLACCDFDPEKDGTDCEVLVGRELLLGIDDETAPDGTIRSRIKRYMYLDPEQRTQRVITEPARTSASAPMEQERQTAAPRQAATTPNGAGIRPPSMSRIGTLPVPPNPMTAATSQAATEAMAQITKEEPDELNMEPSPLAQPDTARSTAKDASAPLLNRLKAQQNPQNP